MPIVSSTGGGHGMSLISAITARGKMRFMIKKKGSVNSDVFITFLKRLMVGAKKPIYLIVAGGTAHSPKLAGKLMLFLLPPCASKSQS